MSSEGHPRWRRGFTARESRIESKEQAEQRLSTASTRRDLTSILDYLTALDTRIRAIEAELDFLEEA